MATTKTPTLELERRLRATNILLAREIMRNCHIGADSGCTRCVQARDTLRENLQAMIDDPYADYDD